MVEAANQQGRRTQGEAISLRWVGVQPGLKCDEMSQCIGRRHMPYDMGVAAKQVRSYLR